MSAIVNLQNRFAAEGDPDSSRHAKGISDILHRGVLRPSLDIERSRNHQRREFSKVRNRQKARN